MEFKRIPKNELERLQVCGRKLSVSEFYSGTNELEFFSIGIKKSIRGGTVDFEIFDWSYYDVLKKYGFSPNLANMIWLHNYIVGEL